MSECLTVLGSYGLAVGMSECLAVGMSECLAVLRSCGRKSDCLLVLCPAGGAVDGLRMFV